MHGFDGVVQVSLPGFPTPLDQCVIATTQEMAAEFPFNQDMNSGNILGEAVKTIKRLLTAHARDGYIIRSVAGGYDYECGAGGVY
jgi:hypothetical protein